MPKPQKLSKALFSFCITTFVVFVSFTINSSRVEALTTSNIIFSEINFLGSSLSPSDEWIELYNTQDSIQDLTGLTLQINSNSQIFLDGFTIQPNSYFLISNFSTNANNSELKLVQDYLVTSSLSLPNPTNGKSLDLKIINKLSGETLDEVSFSGNYQAKNSSNGRYSVYRESLNSLDINFNNWIPSGSRTNLKQSKLDGNICPMDFGTPGAPNTSPSSTDTILEIEDLCLNSGEIISDGSDTFAKVNNFNGNLFTINLDLDQKIYDVKLVGRAEAAKPFSIGKFEVDSGNGKFRKNKINSRKFTEKGFADVIFKNKSRKNSAISFSTNLSGDENIYLDKIIISEISESSRKKVDLANSDLPITESAEEIVENGETVEKISKGSIQNENQILDELYLLDAVNNSQTVPYLATLKVKTENINQEVSDFDPILTFSLENPTTGTLKERNFYKKDFNGHFSEISFATVSDKEGADIFSVKAYGNSDILINGFVFQEIGRSASSVNYEEIPFIESLNKNLVSKVTSEKSSFKKVAGKVFEAKTNNYCVLSQKCNIEINLNAKDFSNSSEDIAKIFIGNKNSESKNSQIIQIRKSDFDKNGNFKIIVNTNSVDVKSKITIYSYGNASLILENPRFTQAQSETKTNLISQNGIDWNQKQILKTEEANGRVLDILESGQIFAEQKFALTYSIKKLESYNSGKDLMKIRIVNDKGNKLTEKIYDENDLEFNKEKIETLNFEMKKTGKFFVYIYFYGNQLGGKADLEIGEININ